MSFTDCVQTLGCSNQKTKQRLVLHHQLKVLLKMGTLRREHRNEVEKNGLNNDVMDTAPEAQATETQ